MANDKESHFRKFEFRSKYCRDYVNAIEFKEVKDVVIDAYHQGESQDRIIALLETQNVQMKKHQLKRLLRLWAVSRKNGKRSVTRGQREVQSNVLASNSESDGSGSWTQNSDESSVDDNSIAHSRSRLQCDRTKSNALVAGVERLFDFNTELWTKHDVFIPTDQLLSFDQSSLTPSEWSENWRLWLDRWISQKRGTAEHIGAKIKAELENSNENFETCCQRVRDNWDPLEWHGQGRDHERRVLPYHIYQSFWEERKEFEEYTEEELIDVALLDQALQRIFPTLLRFSISHPGNTELGWDFRSQVVHLQNIEQMFGTTHMLLVEALFKTAGILNQIEDDPRAPEVGIIISNLILRKIERLGLEKGYDTAHALLHLRRAHEMAGNMEEARDVEDLYWMMRRPANGKYKGAFPRTLAMIQQAEEFFTRQDYDGGIEWLEEVLKNLKIGSTYVRSFNDTHGHYNTAYDFRSLGGAFLLAAVLFEESDLRNHRCLAKAAASFEMAILHFQKAMCRYQNKCNQTIKDVAFLYEKLGEYELAVIRLQEHLFYRRNMYGLGDPLAAASLREIQRVMTKAQSEKKYRFSPETLLEIRGLVGNVGTF